MPPTAPDRYLTLIEATLRSALAGRECGNGTMAEAMAYVELVAFGEESPQFDVDQPEEIVDRRFVDGAGHSRSLYRGLVLYAMGATTQLTIGSYTRFSKSRVPAFMAFNESTSPPLASEGAQVVELAFDALALMPSFLKVATYQSFQLLEAIAARQQPDGSFLLRTASDNPEPTWYHELALLHAVSTFAYRTCNPVAEKAMLRAAQYQAENIQPDHASSHPFALHAFLRIEQGVFLADMMLHAAGVQHPASMDIVSLLLLANALDCMRPADGQE